MKVFEKTYATNFIKVKRIYKMTKTNKKEPKARQIRPALSPEARESQLISLATDLAEQQLMDGTASSQVITHFLKLGSTRERLEKERLTEENELLKAKTKALADSSDSAEKYEEVLAAFRRYSGYSGDDEDD